MAQSNQRVQETRLTSKWAAFFMRHLLARNLEEGVVAFLDDPPLLSFLRNGKGERISMALLPLFRIILEQTKRGPTMNDNLARFLLTFFLGFIGSLIINHSSLKPDGWTSRTGAYIGLSILTLGIYGLVASICNLSFDPSKDSNIGYKKN